MSKKIDSVIQVQILGGAVYISLHANANLFSTMSKIVVQREISSFGTAINLGEGKILNLIHSSSAISSFKKMWLTLYRTTM